MNASFRSNLAAGIEACIGIVRFRKGPEDVPASGALLLVALAGGVILRAATLALVQPEGEGAPVLFVALSMGMTLLFVWLVVQLARRPERFLQAATALFGAQVILTPVLLATGWFFLTYGNDVTWQMPAIMLRLAAEVWVLLIVARIVRSATGWPLFACVALAIAAELLTFLVLSAMIPGSAAATSAAPANA